MKLFYITISVTKAELIHLLTTESIEDIFLDIAANKDLYCIEDLKLFSILNSKFFVIFIDFVKNITT